MDNLQLAVISPPEGDELTRRNIPFVKFGGLKFLDSAQVKDVLAVLRLAENSRDRVAAFRVMQLLPGIGPSDASGPIEAMERALDPALGLQFFGAHVTAEGVETAEQFDWIADNCDQVQGFYIARPMPPADIPAYLAIEADLPRRRHA